MSEADLARNIDRELISYRSLARYFVVTGKEEDGKAALAAEASLKDAIDQSMKGTTNPARREQIAQLGKEFQNFSQIFADILRLKDESAQVTQNQLMRSANMLRYKLDDLPSNADDVGTAIDPVWRQDSNSINSKRRRRSPTYSSSIPTRRPRPAHWRGSNSSITRLARYCRVTKRSSKVSRKLLRCSANTIKPWAS